MASSLHSRRRDNVDTADAIYEIDQPAIVERDVIGGGTILAVCRIDGGRRFFRERAPGLSWRKAGQSDRRTGQV
jgi:hypothetical protein